MGNGRRCRACMQSSGVVVHCICILTFTESGIIPFCRHYCFINLLVSFMNRMQFSMVQCCKERDKCILIPLLRIHRSHTTARVHP